MPCTRSAAACIVELFGSQLIGLAASHSMHTQQCPVDVGGWVFQGRGGLLAVLAGAITRGQHHTLCCLEVYFVALCCFCCLR